jgi:hypothetical protein
MYNPMECVILGGLKVYFRHYTENSFPEKELRGLSPYFHIHVPVSDLYIATVGRPTYFPAIDRPIVGIYKSFTETCM